MSLLPSIDGLQLALVGGALAGLGLAGLLRRIRPAHVDLGDAIDRLRPTSSRRMMTSPTETEETISDVLGRYACKVLPTRVWGALPRQNLALLRKPEMRFYGEKVAFAFVGLVVPPILTVSLSVLGWSPPILLPLGGTLLLAVVMFVIPNFNVADDAKRARAEFGRALGAYTDLVALERNAGSGPRQALEVAAGIGDSWAFRRIREELAFSSWSGEPPWEALRRLASELGVPELTDLADVVRLGGEEGSQIYAQLRARSAATRSAMLTAEISRANEIGEKLSIPMSALGVIFLIILIAPALLRVTSGT